MRIVHVVETLERGGLERMVCDLASEQHRRGHEVRCICVFRRGLLADELQSNGVPVIAAGKQSGLSLRALWRLRSWLSGGQTDIIHTHNATAHYQSVIATLGARRAPIVNTRHGMGGGSGDRREVLFRRALPKTARVVAVCRHAANRFVHDGVVPVGLLGVIPNGIQVERFSSGDRIAARRVMHLDIHAPVVGIVGRLNWAKDHALLLAAFAAVRARVPTAQLIVVGDGELRSAIDAQVRSLGLQSAVQLLGDRSDVPKLLPGLDVFVLSSKTEGYSIALLEAAATGLPCVATDVGGNKEIVQHDVTGLMVPSGNAAALADALVQVLSDVPRRQQMSQAARTWAVEHASVAAMTDAYDALYRDVGLKGATVVAKGELA